MTRRREHILMTHNPVADRDVVMTSLVAHAQVTAAATKSDDDARSDRRSRVEVQLRRRLGRVRFGNSFYQDPKEGVRQNYGDNWMEGYLKPAISGPINCNRAPSFTAS
jgi:hypothetical protein